MLDLKKANQRTELYTALPKSETDKNQTDSGQMKTNHSGITTPHKYKKYFTRDKTRQQKHKQADRTPVI